MLSREIVNFVFPRISMFPETKSRETLRFEGKQNSLFPEGAYIKVIPQFCIAHFYCAHLITYNFIQYTYIV